MDFKGNIKNHPLYYVTSCGRVWSFKTNKFLKPIRTGNYYHVDLDKYPYNIHRLVAEAYLPNPENKPTVDHINRNSFDNRLCNLRWATTEEQITNRNSCGNSHMRVRCVETGEEFKSQADAARKYGISKGNLCEAIKDVRRKMAGGYHWEKI